MRWPGTEASAVAQNVVVTRLHRATTLADISTPPFSGGLRRHGLDGADGGVVHVDTVVHNQDSIVS